MIYSMQQQLFYHRNFFKLELIEIFMVRYKNVRLPTHPRIPSNCSIYFLFINICAHNNHVILVWQHEASKYYGLPVSAVLTDIARQVDMATLPLARCVMVKK